MLRLVENKNCLANGKISIHLKMREIRCHYPDDERALNVRDSGPIDHSTCNEMKVISCEMHCNYYVN